MQILKLLCALLALSYLAQLVRIISEINSVHSGGSKPGLGVAILSLCLLVFWASAAYGIHAKAPVAWKLGWVAIVMGTLLLFAGAWKTISKMPGNDYPGVAAAAVFLGGTAVAVYWGFWWKKQKSYFVRLPK
jgi:hypothetical protein